MVRLRYVAEDIPINKIAAGIESIEQTVYAIEGAKVKIFIIVIFNINSYWSHHADHEYQRIFVIPP